MSNRREDVLYLTLIDFFLQMLFLVMIALLVYMTVQQSNIAKLEEAVKINQQAKEWNDLTAKYGLDSVQELLDKLTTLAPPVNATGGIKRLPENLKKIKDGQGKPPCIVYQSAEHLPKPVATFLATNTNIILLDWQPEFAQLARSLGKGELVPNTRWGLREFVTSWRGVLSKYPECRYTVVLKEKTGLVKPRDHVQSVFYAQIRR